MKKIWILLSFCFFSGPTPVHAASDFKPRARDLGIPFDGTPGKTNSIVDVSGIEVGHETLIQGEGAHAVRTGVTAIHPRGKKSNDRVFASFYQVNGNGEMTGLPWLNESGGLEGPVILTNTHSVGIARDAIIEWQQKRLTDYKERDDYSLPVVAETWDGGLNDIWGFHVKKEDVFKALDAATREAPAEGCVGGGTGMRAFEFKAGIGSSSRTIKVADHEYQLGVLVQANFGKREELVIRGIPVGKQLLHVLRPEIRKPSNIDGSIVAILATDAPLLPHQLQRLAKRASLGMAKTGGIGHNSSGDLFLAFSTANPEFKKNEGVVNLKMIANAAMDPLIVGAVDATEEAIINSMVAACDMTGIDGNKIYAIPHAELKKIFLKK
jgi:D-aminopeptidase